jgi:DNA-binding IclR family transcriptional regulator
LAEGLGESAFLGFRRGDRVVVQDCVEGGHEMCVAARPGVSMPLLAGATGKVFLAGMEPEDVRAAIGNGALPRFTERTITDPEAFLLEIERTRERGYGVDDEEYLKGVRAVVAPVRCGGETVAALWVAGFSASLSAERFPVAAEQLVSEAVTCGRLLERAGSVQHGH